MTFFWRQSVFELGLLALLMMYLGVRWYLRHRETVRQRRIEEEREREFREEWQITPVDLGDLTRRMKSHVDYVAAAQARPRHSDFHEEFMLAVHGVIARMGYFRKVK